MVEVLVPLAVIEVGAAVRVVVSALIGPVVKITVALSVKATAFKIPVIVAVPAVVDDVSVAVYVPSPLSITAVNVPRFEDRITSSPPVEILFPFASFNWIVIVEVVIPSAAMEVVEAVIVEVAALATSVTKLTLALSVIVIVLSVPLIVAMAVDAEEVSTAV